MTTPARLAALLALAAFCAPPYAQTSGSLSVKTPEARLQLSFGEPEIAVIHEYYAPPKGKKPKKQKALPPGQAKKLARGQALPPGIARQVLPPELEARLAPLPPGYGRFVVGADIVLVDTRANVVVDLVASVAF